MQISFRKSDRTFSADEKGNLRVMVRGGGSAKGLGACETLVASGLGGADFTGPGRFEQIGVGVGLRWTSVDLDFDINSILGW